jgi:hypothetical protein
VVRRHTLGGEGDFALLAFGPAATATRTIPASEIAEQLLGTSLWFISRPSKRIAPGMLLLFYQAGHGVIAESRLASVKPVTLTDIAKLNQLGLSYMQYRLDVTAVRFYCEAVRIGPLVDSLDFISNKRYWGHSLRLTPKSISTADASLIRSRAVYRAE